MPVLDESIHNINEFSAVLNEILALINSYDDYQILIGGDFNLELDRDKDSLVFKILLY